MYNNAYTIGMVLINFFIVGYIVLGIAILINILASKVGLGTWYDLIKSPKDVSVVTILWLVWLYPLTLGVSSYFAVTLIF
jgi:hypothetical protein